MAKSIEPVDELEVVKAQNTALMAEVKRLNEIIQLFTKQSFGRSKESIIPASQTSLFDDDTQKKTSGKEDQPPEESTPAAERVRRPKPKGRKQANLNQYPQRAIYHTLEAADQICHDCHQPLTDIGASLVRRELKFVPASFECLNHYQHTYKCPCCSQTAATDQFQKAVVPQAPLTNSLGSASLLAETVYQKYGLKVPAYRQEAHWARLGTPLSRGTLCRWHIKVCEYYLSAVYDAFHQELLTQDIVHTDETTFRVLESQKERTYYWVLQSSKHHERPIVYYAHRDGRGQDKFDSVVGNYQGVIHCDMYSVYPSHAKSHDTIQLAGCWAHLRRKFYEAYVPSADDDSLPARIVRQIGILFHKEKQWQSLSVEDRLHQRQRQLKPLIQDLFRTIEQCYANQVYRGKFYEALRYALNHRSHFYTVLTDGRLELSNNAAERSMRSVVMGRKNQLFTRSFAGARAGAILLSLLETAKRYQVDGRAYIEYLLTYLPNEPSLIGSDLSGYMPWDPHIQAVCRI